MKAPGADTPRSSAEGASWIEAVAPFQNFFRFLSSKRRVLVHSWTDETDFWSAWRLNFLASSRLEGNHPSRSPVDPPLHWIKSWSWSWSRTKTFAFRPRPLETGLECSWNPRLEKPTMESCDLEITRLVMSRSTISIQYIYRCMTDRQTEKHRATAHIGYTRKHSVVR